MRNFLLFTILFAFSTLINAQVDLKKGLVAYYKLDGNAADSGTNSLNGTVNGAINNIGHTGKLNTALRFDGTNDYVDVAHNSKFNLTTNKSVSVWYKIPVYSGFTNYPSLVYKHGIGDYPTFGLFFSEDPAYGANRRKIGFFQGNSITNKTIFTNEKYSDYINQWVHIVGTYSRADGYMRIYFNGEISDSISVPNYTSNVSTEPLQIGRGSVINYSVNYFKGLIDDVRLYDRPLTDEEVDALYNEREYFYRTKPITICQPDSVFAQGKYRNKSGTYYDTINISAKSDSVIITQLTVNPSYYFPISLTVCNGSKIQIGGKLRATAGVYYDSLKTSEGCDSIIQFNLLVNPSYYSTQILQICQGESAVLGGLPRNLSGTYYDSLLTSKGCDSIIVTTLLVNTKYTIQQTKEICDGESILLGGKLQTTGGTYYDSLKTNKGCDSVLVSTLTVNPKYASNQNRTICQGDSIFLAGSYQTKSGFYSDTLFSSKGCDSIIITQLTVNPSYMVQDTKTICLGDSIFIAGNYRYTSGTYYNNLTTNRGCDSIVATNLIVTIYSNVVIQNANVLAAQEGGATYQWLDCNSNNTPIAGETSQIFVATTNGDYAVRVTKNGCTVTSNCIAVVSLSDNRISFKQSLKVYPNPAKNWVKVKLSKVYSKAKVSIYTIEGKKITTSTITNNNIIELSTSEIEAGIYLMEIIADDNRALSRIVIEN